MSKATNWAGFPEEYQGNAGTHYLLNLATGEEIRASYCPYDEEWSGPGFMLGRKNTAKYYSYLRPFTIVLSVAEIEAQETLKKQAIAEAVAAERERILRTHNISTEDDLFWYFDDREHGHNDASELLQACEFEIVHIATGRNTGELFGFSANHEDHFFKTKAEAETAIEAIRSTGK